MKKYILAVLLALVGTTAFAQKGMQGFGMNFEASWTKYFNAFGGGIKYQYNVANRDRIEASFSFRTEGEWDFAVSNHFFFNGVKRVRPYLIAGIFVGGITYEDWVLYDYYKNTAIDLGPRGGLGIDFRLSHKLSCQLEASGKFFIRHDAGAALARLGITYNF